MKNKIHILILFLILLVFPISRVLACLNFSENDKTEKTFCSKEYNHFEIKLCVDNEKKDDDDCGGACYNITCHCLSTVNIPIFYTAFKLSNSYKSTLSVDDWAYIQNVPKAVYLSIWQPPKIS